MENKRNNKTVKSKILLGSTQPIFKQMRLNIFPSPSSYSPSLYSPFINKCPFQLNKPNTCNGLELMKYIKNASVQVVLLDPQYRNILDKMNYGNEGKRQAARILLPQMDDQTIIQFIIEINRVLIEGGYLFLWIDKYILLHSDYLNWLSGTKIETLSMITWDKGRIGMGYRARAKCEYLLICQKRSKKNTPCRWKNHYITDIHTEKIPNNMLKFNPHVKPLNLTKKVIESVTDIGDFVLDPCAGSYITLIAGIYEANGPLVLI